jgi:hypothetical protein
MKSLTEFLWFTAKQRRDLVNIYAEFDPSTRRRGVSDDGRRKKRVVVKIIGE